MEEEIEDGGVVDGLDLLPSPIVPGAFSDRPIRLDGGGRGGEGGMRSWRPESGSKSPDQKHPLPRALSLSSARDLWNGTGRSSWLLGLRIYARDRHRRGGGYKG